MMPTYNNCFGPRNSQKLKALIESPWNFELQPPSMTARGPGHRRLSADDAYYHTVPQSPLAPNPIALSESLAESLVLDPENDEDVIGEAVMAVEVTPGIRWVHFIFGCATLLPWNGMSSQNRHFATVIADLFPQ